MYKILKWGCSQPTGSGEANDFLGVYSGRIGASHLEAQLGIVWKAQVIDEIIDGSKHPEL